MFRKALFPASVGLIARDVPSLPTVGFRPPRPSFPSLSAATSAARSARRAQGGTVGGATTATSGGAASANSLDKLLTDLKKFNARTTAAASSSASVNATNSQRAMVSGFKQNTAAGGGGGAAHLKQDESTRRSASSSAGRSGRPESADRGTRGQYSGSGHRSQRHGGNGKPSAQPLRGDHRRNQERVAASSSRATGVNAASRFERRGQNTILRPSPPPSSEPLKGQNTGPAISAREGPPITAPGDALPALARTTMVVPAPMGVADRRPRSGEAAPQPTPNQPPVASAGESIVAQSASHPTVVALSDRHGANGPAAPLRQGEDATVGAATAPIAVRSAATPSTSANADGVASAPPRPEDVAAPSSAPRASASAPAAPQSPGAKRQPASSHSSAPSVEDVATQIAALTAAIAAKRRELEGLMVLARQHATEIAVDAAALAPTARVGLSGVESIDHQSFEVAVGDELDALMAEVGDVAVVPCRGVALASVVGTVVRPPGTTNAGEAARYVGFSISIASNESVEVCLRGDVLQQFALNEIRPGQLVHAVGPLGAPCGARLSSGQESSCVVVATLDLHDDGCNLTIVRDD